MSVFTPQDLLNDLQMELGDFNGTNYYKLIMEMQKKAVEDEREACAKIAEKVHDDDPDGHNPWECMCGKIADDIRGRGK